MYNLVHYLISCNAAVYCYNVDCKISEMFFWQKFAVIIMANTIVGEWYTHKSFLSHTVVENQSPGIATSQSVEHPERASRVRDCLSL